MNGEEVLKLIDAGFTADEIRKMSDGQTVNEPSTGTDSGETPPTTEIDTKSSDNFMDEIRKSVEDISNKVKALQDANIKQAEEKKTEHISAADVVTSFMENL